MYNKLQLILKLLAGYLFATMVTSNHIVKNVIGQFQFSQEVLCFGREHKTFRLLYFQWQDSSAGSIIFYHIL